MTTPDKTDWQAVDELAAYLTDPQNLANSKYSAKARAVARAYQELRRGVTREQLAKVLYEAQAKILETEPATWEEMLKLSEHQPWQKKAVDFVYGGIDALLAAFPQIKGGE